MTNYITDMMKTAGCKQQYCGWLDMGDLDTQYQYIRCNTVEEWNEIAEFSRTSYSVDKNNEDWKPPELKYPIFTPEKQLEIIKLIGKFETSFTIYSIPYEDEGFHWYVLIPNGNCNFCCQHKNFTQALAQLTTELMNAGELDKEKVKEILEK